mgnify:CR=1 FL=1
MLFEVATKNTFAYKLLKEYNANIINNKYPVMPFKFSHNNKTYLCEPYACNTFRIERIINENNVNKTKFYKCIVIQNNIVFLLDNFESIYALNRFYVHHSDEHFFYIENAYLIIIDEKVMHLFNNTDVNPILQKIKQRLPKYIAKIKANVFITTYRTIPILMLNTQKSKWENYIYLNNRKLAIYNGETTNDSMYTYVANLSLNI